MTITMHRLSAALRRPWVLRLFRPATPRVDARDGNRPYYDRDVQRQLADLRAARDHAEVANYLR